MMIFVESFPNVFKIYQCTVAQAMKLRIFKFLNDGTWLKVSYYICVCISVSNGFVNSLSESWAADLSVFVCKHHQPPIPPENTENLFLTIIRLRFYIFPFSDMRTFPHFPSFPVWCASLFSNWAIEIDFALLCGLSPF